MVRAQPVRASARPARPHPPPLPGQTPVSCCELSVPWPVSDQDRPGFRYWPPFRFRAGVRARAHPPARACQGSLASQTPIGYGRLGMPCLVAQRAAIARTTPVVGSRAVPVRTEQPDHPRAGVNAAPTLGPAPTLAGMARPRWTGRRLECRSSRSVPRTDCTLVNAMRSHCVKL